MIRDTRRDHDISSLVDSYVLFTPASERYEAKLRLVARLYGEWLGRAPVLSDFSAQQLSRWLVALDKTKAPRTIHNYRACLVTLWYHASASGLIEPPPTRMIRRVHVPRPRPDAWTLDELRKILAAAAELKGYLRRSYCPKPVARSAYFVTLIHTAYETGLRRGDLWTLERRDIQPTGRIVARLAKTGMVHVCRVSDGTRKLLIAMPGRRPLAWNRDEKRYYQHWRTICRTAGVTRGATHKVRRTAATQLWVKHPGEVQRFLGHLTPTMQRHYVDLRFGNDPPTPPPIRKPR